MAHTALRVFPVRQEREKIKTLKPINNKNIMETKNTTTNPEPTVTPCKMVASLLWLTIVISPFCLAICCAEEWVALLGIVYGVIVWELCKKFMPKWMIANLKHLFREND